MLESITQWLDGLSDMAREIIDTPQIILLAIVFLVGWLLQFLLRRLLHTLEQRLPEARWSSSLLLISRRLGLPLTVLVLGSLAVVIIEPLGLNVRY